MNSTYPIPRMTQTLSFPEEAQISELLKENQQLEEEKEGERDKIVDVLSKTFNGQVMHETAVWVQLQQLKKTNKFTFPECGSEALFFVRALFDALKTTAQPITPR